MRSEHPPLQVFLLMIATAAVLAGGALPAFSVEACGFSEIRSLMPEPDDESGIGGTGIRGARPHARDDDSESGIGGTGIMGSVGIVGIVDDLKGVTQPDRLCVNGLEIRVPEQLSILAPGGEASDRSLAAGMVIWMRATRTDEGLVADHIQIQPDLAGQIEILSRDAKELIVSGRRVRLPDDVRRGPGLADDEPHAGQWIVFFGLLDDSGQLIATRIERGRERETRLALGGFANWLRENTGIRTVSIEGFITGSRERPQLAGLLLEFGPEVSRARQAPLEPGMRIRVEGRTTPGQVLQIEGPVLFRRPGRVEFAPRATPPRPPLEAPQAKPEAVPPRPQIAPPRAKDGDRRRPSTIDRLPYRPPDRPPERLSRPPPRPERPEVRPSIDRLK